MKRSEINRAIKAASACFAEHGWALPPRPRWDVTDFGLGDFDRFGLVLVNLTEEPEYCEKLMYARRGQKTPAHSHGAKKEDIICRWGILMIQVWADKPNGAGANESKRFTLKVNGVRRELSSNDILALQAGERVTLEPGCYHEFYPDTDACIIGEVSTYNDDATDNHFVSSDIGRFSDIDEDEPPIEKLINE